jgi:hypothetical protein
LATVSDEATGYPAQPVARCLVTQRFLAEVEAYNDTMRKWYAAHKPERFLFLLLVGFGVSSGSDSYPLLKLPSGN